jgi:WD40 repeat protein
MFNEKIGDSGDFLGFVHLRTLKQDTASVHASVYSPDGSFIASAGDKKILLWDSATGQLMHTLEGHTNFVNDCTVSPDSQLIASASNDGTIRLWNSVSGQHLNTKEVYRMVEACAFTPDGQTIVYVDYENIVHSWKFNRDQESSIGIFEDRNGLMHFCAVSPEGDCVVYILYFDGLQVWDRHSGEILLELEGNPREVSNCSFSPDGRMILAAGKEIWLWDSATGEQIGGFKGHSGYVWGCEFSPDGRFIISASKDKTLRVWEVASGEMIGLLSWARSLKSMGLHPWAPQLVCGNDKGVLYVLEIENLQYGPIIVTAFQVELGFEILCPTCQHRFRIAEDQLGSETTCLRAGCNTQLKINPFIIHHNKDQ